MLSRWKSKDKSEKTGKSSSSTGKKKRKGRDNGECLIVAKNHHKPALCSTQSNFRYSIRTFRSSTTFLDITLSLVKPDTARFLYSKF